ncbi:putative PE-PGRS family protein PE_PGRS24 [Mycobacterium simulans]|uniref:PE family protein n=1 Tax=Mycobacterium simulans TaxID=627089 RepID=UPI00174A3CE1|nr:PE family protein [Mycobacterium simulans]SON59248.1 putative PE-PGRS family protein PE_PGRS24 [Mycobacterium simulans]
MSHLVVAPEALSAAASDLARIESTLSAANAAAVAQTTSLLAAGADEVSAAIAAVFSAQGQGYQALSTQAAAFHAAFEQALAAGAGSYASAEAAAATPLQELLNVINAPFLTLTGRPLVGAPRRRLGRPCRRAHRHRLGRLCLPKRCRWARR